MVDRAPQGRSLCRHAGTPSVTRPELNTLNGQGSLARDAVASLYPSTDRSPAYNWILRDFPAAVLRRPEIENWAIR
jgi:hypothetical protein